MGKVEKQSTVWQSNSMGTFDGLKLKFNNFVIDQTINLTKQMLAKIKAENMSIDKTILIGGSSRIPLVSEELNKILSSSALHVNDLDVAVANGAAVFINQGEVVVKKCFCRNCGQALNTKMRFCNNCGKDNIRYDYRFKDMK